jgi:gluconolactonase
MKKLNLILVAMLITHSIHAQIKTIGKIISIDPKFSELISLDSQIELLGEGFVWTEGPVWISGSDCLLFSDVPKNTIYKWKKGEEISVFMNPSGYTGVKPYSNEPGSNGLSISNDGYLIACEHGDRRISKMPLSIKGGKVTLADKWQGKRFNSPNDLVQSDKGIIYFTDPPYGLPNYINDSSREIDLFGVYSVDAKGVVKLLIKDLERPNGVAISPDQKTLYVAQSEPKNPVIMKYPILENGTVGKGTIFFDAMELFKQGLPGLPDGLKVDVNGNVFSTGPGGVLVISANGKLLGRIDTGVPTANLAWGEDGSTLFITAQHYLCKIKTKTIGYGPKKASF